MANTTNESAVSWGAVIAGAAGAAVLSLVLFVLGSGLGLAAVSPWARDGISGTTAGVSTIVWVTIVQLLASALGGYLAGRLRTRWVTVHTNEVFFRDTAHGFLAWGVSTLLMATLLSSAVGGVLSTGAKAGGAVAASASGPMSDAVDTLLRNPSGRSATADRAPEITRIFARSVQSGELAPSDSQYLGQMVAANTGISQSEAERRVADTFQQLKQSLDQARKASAWLALWLVVSLLIGAFVASYSATLGGRLRDSSVLAPI
jgi:hypothetical protein